MIWEEVLECVATGWKAGFFLANYGIDWKSRAFLSSRVRAIADENCREIDDITNEEENERFLPPKNPPLSQSSVRR